MPVFYRLGFDREDAPVYALDRQIVRLMNKLHAPVAAHTYKKNILIEPHRLLPPPLHLSHLCYLLNFRSVSLDGAWDLHKYTVKAWRSQFWLTMETSVTIPGLTGVTAVLFTTATPEEQTEFNPFHQTPEIEIGDLLDDLLDEELPYGPSGPAPRPNKGY